MIWMLIALAQAGHPGDEALLDLDRWDAAADRLVDGPDGCWVFEGEATQTVVVYQAPSRMFTASQRTIEAQGPFTARLEGQRWVKIQYEPESSDPDLDLDLDLWPLMGKLSHRRGEGEREEVAISLSSSGGEDGAQISGGVKAGMGLLHEAFEKLTGSVETGYATWDEQRNAVRYLREVAVSDERKDKTVTVAAWYPDGGAHATRIDAAWPKQMKLGRWPARITLRDPQMHVQGFVYEDQVLPNAESVSLVAGFFGFTVGFEQQLRYRTATPCVPDAEASHDEDPAPSRARGPG